MRSSRGADGDKVNSPTAFLLTVRSSIQVLSSGVRARAGDAWAGRGAGPREHLASEDAEEIPSIPRSSPYSTVL